MGKTIVQVCDIWCDAEGCPADTRRWSKAVGAGVTAIASKIISREGNDKFCDSDLAMFIECDNDLWSEEQWNLHYCSYLNIFKGLKNNYQYLDYWNWGYTIEIRLYKCDLLICCIYNCMICKWKHKSLNFFIWYCGIKVITIRSVWWKSK